MNSWLKCLVVLLFLSGVVACTTPQPETDVSAGNEDPTEVRDAQLLGEPYIEPRYEQVMAVNCDGQSRDTSLQRSLSQGQTTFFDVQVGIGGLVRGAIIPDTLEAELEAKIKAALGRVLSNTYQQSVTVGIETEPGTAYLHTVTWNETKVKGVIEVVYPSGIGRVGFEKIIGLELGDRTSEALSCPGMTSITAELPSNSPTPLNIATPVSLTPTSPSSSLQPVLEPTVLSQVLVSTTEPSNNCSTLIEGEHHNPVLGTDWEFEAINEDRIIHVWSNHWAPNLPEYKFFLPAGQAVSFKSGGGSFWIDRPGCDGVAEVLFQRDTFREITIEEYQGYIEQQIIP